MKYLVSSRFLIISLVLIFSSVTIPLANGYRDTHTIPRKCDYQECTRHFKDVRCDNSGRTESCECSCTARTVRTDDLSVTFQRCRDGWGPEPECNDYNECRGNVCGHKCTNTFGSYICSCNTGYRLASDRSTCNDIDECQERTSSCSQICYNTVGSYTCGCNTRYTLASDRRTCNDIDECTANTPGCTHNCSNTIGSYTCSCTAGYRLATDGRSCIDIDECTAQLDNCTLLENFTCENNIGGYQCVCKTGFEQVGPRECSDINECESLTNNCTLYENLICQNIIGGYNCLPDSRGMSEATAKVVIGVTVGVVVGIILIIIAVVCFVKRAKKRKRNAEESAQIQASSEIEYAEVADVSRNRTKAKLDDLNTQEQTAASCSTPGSEKADSKETATGQSTLANISIISKGVKGLFKFQKGKKDLRNEEATTDFKYEGLATMTETNQLYEDIRIPSKSTDISVQGEANKDSSHTGSEKADSKETATGESTSAKVNKSDEEHFKSKKEKKNLKTGESISESTYQELSAMAETKDVYEPIKKQPLTLIDILVKGKASSDSSHT